MTIDLSAISDDALVAEYRRREAIERNFAWSVSLMREYAIWENESGRARRMTEWHARQVAEKLCIAFDISREEFARRLIEHERRGSGTEAALPRKASPTTTKSVQ